MIPIYAWHADIPIDGRPAEIHRHPYAVANAGQKKLDGLREAHDRTWSVTLGLRSLARKTSGRCAIETCCSILTSGFGLPMIRPTTGFHLGTVVVNAKGRIRLPPNCPSGCRSFSAGVPSARTPLGSLAFSDLVQPRTYNCSQVCGRLPSSCKHVQGSEIMDWNHGLSLNGGRVRT